MSGHNGRDKYQLVNRENWIANLQTIGAIAQYGLYKLQAPGNITGAGAATGNVQLDVGSSATVNFPTGLEWRLSTQQLYALQNGSGITVRVTNTSGADRTIQFPGVVTEGIPPRQTEMSNGSGSNSTIVPVGSALDLEIFQVGPERYVVYPLGAGAASTFVGAVSVGTGSSIVQNGSPPVVTLRSILGGQGITTVQNANDVTLNFNGVNLGAGQPLFVPGTQAGFKTITTGTGISLTPSGTELRINSTTTQQIAYNNSVAAADFPTIDLASLQTFTIGTGPTFQNIRHYSFLDSDLASSIIAIRGPLFTLRYAIRVNRPASAPDYGNETTLKKDIVIFGDAATQDTYGGSVRSIHHNGHYSSQMHGMVMEGRPVVTNFSSIGNPSVPLPNPQGLMMSGIGGWYLNNTHPDDPNSGWNWRGYNIEGQHIADNTTAAIPVAPTNGTVGTWTQFGVNNGISLGNVQYIAYPVGAHLAPHRLSYCLGMFEMTNTAVAAAPGVITNFNLAKNVMQNSFTQNNSPNEYDSCHCEIKLLALDITNAANTVAYHQTYHLTGWTNPLTSVHQITQISSVQTGSVVNFPPPTLSVFTPDMRPGIRVFIQNGANGTTVSRRFVYQIWVIRYDVVMLNP